MHRIVLRPFLPLLLVIALVVSACEQKTTPAKPNSQGTAAPTSAPPRAVRIAAASDLKFALEEIITAFKADLSGVEITPTYGSSGNFFSQLSSKAPFDLYLSADLAYPQKLVDAGLAQKETLFTYAVGRIVLWMPNQAVDQPPGSESAVSQASAKMKTEGLRFLLDPAIRKIAIANPAHAPYGRAAEAALTKAGILEEVRPKLVLGENIAQTAQFVESGNAQAGIIALSLALAPAMKDKGTFFEVPLAEYPPLQQGGVILSWAQDAAAAAEFRAFLLSEKGTAILKRYGFILPD